MNDLKTILKTIPGYLSLDPQPSIIEFSASKKLWIPWQGKAHPSLLDMDTSSKVGATSYLGPVTWERVKFHPKFVISELAFEH